MTSNGELVGDIHESREDAEAQAVEFCDDDYMDRADHGENDRARKDYDGAYVVVEINAERQERIHAIVKFLKKSKWCVDNNAIANAIKTVGWVSDFIFSEDIDAIRDALDDAGVDYTCVYEHENAEYEVATLCEYEAINPENDQHTVSFLGDDMCANDAHEEREMTVTTQYHDWHNTITDQYYYDINHLEHLVNNLDEESEEYESSLAEAKKEFEEASEKYRESARQLKSSYNDTMSAVEDIIEESRAQIFG